MNYIYTLRERVITMCVIKIIILFSHPIFFY